jgi:FKBP-type peptidyl-prolyl cis-trans isomerase FkpA
MSSVRERVFAWVGVGVAVLAAVALSAAVIVQQVIANQQSSQQTSPTLSCTDSNIEPTYAAPAQYVPSQPVTILQTTDLTVGNGKAAKNGDCLVVKYYGTLATNGVKFDENYTQPTAFAFTLGQGQVIQGWDQGLVGMKIGGERRLVIPATMAYGSTGSGAIPANAALVFYVRLLKIT